MVKEVFLSADEQWQAIAKDIIKNGWEQKPENVRAKYASDGAPATTKYVIAREMRFSGKVAPILFSKKTFQRTSIHEIIWIWILRTNKISELRKRNVTIWDDWVYEQGTYADTIGPAYGFILNLNMRRYPTSKIHWDKISKEYQLQIDPETEEEFVMLDQVDYLIQELINNPSSRRLIVDLWDVKYLDDMFLEPCVYGTEWHVDEDNYLHLICHARSQDFCVGTPFNIFQYYVLQCVISKITGRKVGPMIYRMGDTHIYLRHIQNAKKMIKNDTSGLEATITIHEDVNNLLDFDVDKYTIEGYKDRHFEELDFEIAK